MRIQTNSTSAVNSSPDLIKIRNHLNQIATNANEARIKARSQDIFEFNNGPEPFVSYDNKGNPLGFRVDGVDISGGKPMTDDEKWAALQAKYKGVPMFEKVATQMIDDMYVSGLISKEETYAAISHLTSFTADKDIVYDMQNGLLGDDPTPASILLLDFNELLADVSNESKEYSGYNSRNDQRNFLKSLYTKLIDQQAQN